MGMAQKKSCLSRAELVRRSIRGQMLLGYTILFGVVPNTSAFPAATGLGGVQL